MFSIYYQDAAMFCMLLNVFCFIGYKRRLNGMTYLLDEERKGIEDWKEKQHGPDHTEPQI